MHGQEGRESDAPLTIGRPRNHPHCLHSPLACALQEVRETDHRREPSTDSLVWFHLQPSAQQLMQFCGSGHNGGRVNCSDHAGREAIHKVRRLAAAAR